MPLSYIMVQLSLTGGDAQRREFVRGVEQLVKSPDLYGKVRKVHQTFGNYDLLIESEGGSVDQINGMIDGMRKLNGFYASNTLYDKSLEPLKPEIGLRVKEKGDPI